MTTLHIEHSLTDFEVWQKAYASFADRRQEAGVRAERISRPIDDAHYVVIDLDFDTAAQANRFLGFLTTQIWATPRLSPALNGVPTTKILETVTAGAVS
jgi:hypothetical protein